MATTDPPSTDSLAGSLNNKAGPDTSTHAGDATTKQQLTQTPIQMMSQTTSKRSSGWVSSSVLSTNANNNSSKCANKKLKAGPPLPTEGHFKIRAAVDRARQWELDLEEVHGLSDEEACIVVAMATKHLRYEEFPSVLKGDLKFINFAKEGWKLLKEARRVRNAYPKCRNQTFVNGVWKMYQN
jgi:hypothetical protein